MAPPYANSALKVMRVRDPALSSFDPLEAAIESLASVSVCEALPTPAEMAGFQALVVAARSTSEAGFTAADIRKSVAAVADKPLPILWLAGRIDAGSAAEPGDPIPVSWPVPLSRLASFVTAG